MPDDPVPATWNIHYVLHIDNVSTITCTNVVVTDTKDARTYYDESLPGFTDRLSEDTFTWHVGSIGPGQRRTILLIVTTGPSLAGRTVRNRAWVSSDQSPSVSATRDTRVGPPPATNTPMPTHTATPTSTPTATATATRSSDVRLRLEPDSATVGMGQPFTQLVVVEAGAQAVAAADVFIDFDPSYVEVTGMEGGTALTLLSGTYDGVTGHIDIGAGNLGTPVGGTFTLATLHMRALGGSASVNTALTFSLSPPRRTTLKDEADRDVLGILQNASLLLAAQTPTATPRAFEQYLPLMVHAGLP